MRDRPRIGVFDHLSANRGGGQLVVARMAAVLSQKYSVEVVYGGAGYALADLARAFRSDLSRVKERVIRHSLGSFAIPGERSVRWYVGGGWMLDRTPTKPYDLFIYSSHGCRPCRMLALRLAAR